MIGLKAADIAESINTAPALFMARGDAELPNNRFMELGDEWDRDGRGIKPGEGGPEPSLFEAWIGSTPGFIWGCPCSAQLLGRKRHLQAMLDTPQQARSKGA